MADPPATFHRYFQTQPNPYTDPNVLYGTFAPAPAIQPATVLALVESLSYP